MYTNDELGYFIDCIVYPCYHIAKNKFRYNLFYDSIINRRCIHSKFRFMQIHDILSVQRTVLLKVTTTQAREWNFLMYIIPGECTVGHDIPVHVPFFFLPSLWYLQIIVKCVGKIESCIKCQISNLTRVCQLSTGALPDGDVQLRGPRPEQRQGTCLLIPLSRGKLCHLHL